MATPIKIPDFQQSRAIVDKEGRPFAEFLRGINTAFRVLVNNANATNQALAAAGIATSAATVAMAAAAAAQSATLQAMNATALANSYVQGLTITASDAGASASIVISNHNRVYATMPPTSVAVTGATLTGKAYSSLFFLYYDQPTRSGGPVSFIASLVSTDVAQVGDRHSVGQILTPAALGLPRDGAGVAPPGGAYTFEP